MLELQHTASTFIYNALNYKINSFNCGNELT